jgi:iron complex transport system substrate-binding protein
MNSTRILGITLLAAALASQAHAQAPEPRRIVSVSPPVTEILFALGVIDRVVAVSDFCTFPAAVKILPRVGGWQSVSLENVVSLRPDLVIVADVQGPFVVENLKRLKLNHLVVPSQSLDDTFRAIDLIGRATGRRQQAEALVRDTRAALDQVRAKTNTLPKRTVLAVVDRTPGSLRDLTVATPGSFLAELVEMAGGRLVTSPAKAGYITINKEAIFSLDPDVILDIVHTPGGRTGEDGRAVWAPMGALRAVHEGKVHPIHDEFILHTSQFVAQSVRLIAETIHGAAFGNRR